MLCLCLYGVITGKGEEGAKGSVLLIYICVYLCAPRGREGRSREEEARERSKERTAGGGRRWAEAQERRERSKGGRRQDVEAQSERVCAVYYVRKAVSGAAEKKI